MATTGKHSKLDENLMPPRRSRVRYTVEQVKRLEEEFSLNQYPESATQEQIASEFGVSVERIHIWFQNRRSKFKRESKTDHVMWMRKQIFQNDDGKGLSFPFGTPRLPPLTNSCHVLSPPGSMQCTRQDIAWEKPPVNLKNQQSPPMEFDHILDLRTSPESVSSTPNRIPQYLPSQTQPPSCRENRIHGNTLFHPSPSPCRYTSPPPAHVSSATPLVPKNRFTPVLPAFARKILSPIGFHDNVSINNRSTNNISGNDLHCSPYFQHWSPAPAFLSPANVYMTSPVFPQNRLNFCLEEKPTDSSASHPRKRARDECVDSVHEGNKRVKVNIDVEPDISNDACAVERNTSTIVQTEEDPEYNSDSSIHVDLDVWL